MGLNLNSSLRWTGWLVVFAAAAAFASITVVACYSFGLQSQLFSTNPHRNAMIFAAVDVAKIVLPGFLVWFWASGHRLAALSCSLAFVAFLGASLFAAFSIATMTSATRDAGATIAASKLAALQTQLSRAETELKALGETKPVDKAFADLQRHKSSPKWRDANQCLDGKVSAGTFNFCRDYNTLIGNLAAANRAKELRADITSIETKIAESTTFEAVLPANPAAAIMARILDVAPETINTTWAVIIAVAVELISAALPSTVWHLRPTTPVAPAAPAAKASRVAASREEAPSSPRPTSQPPRRGVVPRKPTGKRGRPRNLTLLDFVRAYTLKHGRPPTLPEASAVIGDVPRTTFRRACQETISALENGARASTA